MPEHDLQSGIERAARDEPYFSMRRATAQDKSLSWEARGVLAYLLSKPTWWRVMVGDLIREGCGRDKVYHILDELLDAGYLKRAQMRDGQRLGKVAYRAYEKPLPLGQRTPSKAKQKRERRERRSQRPDFQDAENSQLSGSQLPDSQHADSGIFSRAGAGAAGGLKYTEIRVNSNQESNANALDSAAPVSDKPETLPPAPGGMQIEDERPTDMPKAREPESVRSDGVPALNETPNVPPAPPVEPTKPKRARSIQQRALVCECGAAMTGTRAELQAAGWRWKGPLGKGEPREAMCPACREKKLHPGKMMDAFFEPLKRPQAAGAMPPPEFDMACIARLMQRYIDSGITREQMNEAGWIFGAWWVIQNVKPVLIWTEAQANYVIKGAIQMVRAGHDRYSFAEWMQAEVGKSFWMSKSISFDYAMKNVGMRRQEVAA